MKKGIHKYNPFIFNGLTNTFPLRETHFGTRNHPERPGAGAQSLWICIDPSARTAAGGRRRKFRNKLTDKTLRFKFRCERRTEKKIDANFSCKNLHEKMKRTTFAAK